MESTHSHGVAELGFDLVVRLLSFHFEIVDLVVNLAHFLLRAHLIVVALFDDVLIGLTNLLVGLGLALGHLAFGFLAGPSRLFVGLVLRLNRLLGGFFLGLGRLVLGLLLRLLGLVLLLFDRVLTGRKQKQATYTG